jgi:hypothetical protein
MHKTLTPQRFTDVNYKVLNLLKSWHPVISDLKMQARGCYKGFLELQCLWFL